MTICDERLLQTLFRSCGASETYINHEMPFTVIICDIGRKERVLKSFEAHTRTRERAIEEYSHDLWPHSCAGGARGCKRTTDEMVSKREHAAQRRSNGWLGNFVLLSLNVCTIIIKYMNLAASSCCRAPYISSATLALIDFPRTSVSTAINTNSSCTKRRSVHTTCASHAQYIPRLSLQHTCTM